MLSNLSQVTQLVSKCQNQALNLGSLYLMAMLYCLSTKNLYFSVSYTCHSFSTTPEQVYIAWKFLLPHYCLFLHSQLSAVCFTSSFLIFHNSTFGITHEQHAIFNCQIFFHKLSHLNLEVRMKNIVPMLRMKEPKQATCLMSHTTTSGKVD